MLELFLTGGLSALWNALVSRLFGKKKDFETQEAEHEATVAEKQAAIVADHTRPDASSSLHDGSF